MDLGRTIGLNGTTRLQLVEEATLMQSYKCRNADAFVNSSADVSILNQHAFIGQKRLKVEE